MNDPAFPQRKRIRLPADAYADPGTAWLVTIDTLDRVPAFTNHPLAHDIAALLVDRCAATGAVLDAYCLMPDHAHLLLQITTDNLIDVIRDVKSRSTRLWWQHGGAGPLWQRSFHDRGVRTHADYDHALAYILDNPVRAGLVPDWSDYPFTGGALITPTDDPDHPAAPAPTVVVWEDPVSSRGPTETNVRHGPPVVVVVGEDPVSSRGPQDHNRR